MVSRSIATRPWQRVGGDIFQYGNKNYLILADYYSSYFEIDQLNSISSESVIKACKKQFARHGIPNVLVTDCGT